jgi:hypothetical protein
MYYAQFGSLEDGKLTVYGGITLFEDLDTALEWAKTKTKSGVAGYKSTTVIPFNKGWIVRAIGVRDWKSDCLVHKAKIYK